MNKKLVSLLAVALLGTTLFGCGSNDVQNDQTEAEEVGVPVYTKIVEAEHFDRKISIGGLTQAATTINVMPKIAGMEKINAVYANVGDSVSAGQVLAELDRESAQLQYDTAKLQYDDILRTLGRMEELYEAGAISAMDYEQAKLGAESSAKNLSALQMSLDNLVITAPISGTITSASAEVGAYATASMPMFAIADVSTLEVQAGINENNIGKIYVGQKVDLTIDAASKENLTGVITEIGKVMDTATKTFPVKIAIDNAQGDLMAGMYADVAIVTDTVIDGIIIPVDAMSYEDGKAYVMVVVDGHADRKDIVTGINDGNTYQVLDGLAFGDEVVVKGNTNLVTGDLVAVMKVVNREETAQEDTTTLQNDEQEPAQEDTVQEDTAQEDTAQEDTEKETEN